jgi:haloalkane dehalogenase
VTEIFRTPDERFADLPDFPYEPRYREWSGMRLAHVDEGDGAPVVLFHGEPTWSFLWRKVMAPLIDEGHRCIAGDLPASGAPTSPSTSAGTPTTPTWPPCARCSRTSTCAARRSSCTTGAARSGCGSPSSCPERIDRLVMMDTGLFTGRQRMPEPGTSSRTSSSAQRTCRCRCSSAAPA